MNDDTTDRRARLGVWLQKHVAVATAQREVTISEIEFEWSRASGSFAAAIDGRQLDGRFDIGFEANGRIKFSPPMYHSPMGVPASFDSIILSSGTTRAIQEGLESIIPSIRPFGWNKDVDRIIDAMSSLDDRLYDKDAFEAKRRLIDEGGVSVTVLVDI